MSLECNVQFGQEEFRIGQVILDPVEFIQGAFMHIIDDIVIAIGVVLDKLLVETLLVFVLNLKGHHLLYDGEEQRVDLRLRLLAEELFGEFLCGELHRAEQFALGLGILLSLVHSQNELLVFVLVVLLLKLLDDLVLVCELGD